jgi:transcriptional regulator with XRE-family HTH domain
MVGDTISRLRDRAGMNQTQLGGKLGLSQNAISLYERGIRAPSLAQARAIVLACGAKPSQELALYRALAAVSNHARSTAAAIAALQPASAAAELAAWRAAAEYDEQQPIAASA